MYSLTFGHHHLTLISAKPPASSAAGVGSGTAGASRVPLPETVKLVLPKNPVPETDPVAPANSPVPPLKIKV
jgi:hypothetical protein